jgi:hypothetical protein
MLPAAAQQLIDAVNWGQLQDAYGSAREIPATLHAVTSEDAQQRQEALDDLFGRIWHQGTVYSASAPAARVLRLLLLDRHSPDRHSMAILLGCIARGTSEHAVHEPLLPGAVPDLQERIREESMWVSAAVDAVREGLDDYIALLADPDPMVREGAAYALSSLPDGHDVIVGVIAGALLRALAGEADPRVRLSLWLSLARLPEAPADVLEAATRELPALRPDAVVAAYILWKLDGRRDRQILQRLRRAKSDEGFIRLLDEIQTGDHELLYWLDEWNCRG